MFSYFRSLKIGAWMAPLVAVFMLAAPSSASIPGYPEAGNVADIDVTNSTPYDSWVDISWSYPGQGWHINEAFCLRSQQTRQADRIRFSTTFNPEIRVRGEIKLHGCNNGTHKVVYASATILKDRPRFHAWITEAPPGNIFGVRLENLK